MRCRLVSFQRSRDWTSILGRGCELAQLPRSSATERLVSLIAALPDGSSARLDAARASARLIDLLPQRVSSNPSKMWLGSGAASNPRAAIYLCVNLYGHREAAQCIIASRQPPAQVDDARAAASPQHPIGTPANDDWVPKEIIT